MNPASTSESRLQHAVDSYVNLAHHHEIAKRLDAAWACLEAAHVLGQRSTRLHLRAHVAMLGLAWRSKDARELLGQLLRIAAAALITRIWVPQGNPGSSDVSVWKSMPIPDDLKV